MKYNYHQDPGHGWIEVPLAEIKALGIEGKISHFSYRRGDVAYLEEDLDAGYFVNAKGRDNVELVHKHVDHDHPIRNYDHYYN